MAITGIPPNGWGGGFGAPPPPDHHANIHFLEATRSGPYPGCTPALVQMVLGNGSCNLTANGPNYIGNPVTPIPNGSYTQEPPNGWGNGSAPGLFLLTTSVGGYGQTPAGSSIINSWGDCQDWSIEFQMRDANGNGVEMDTPTMTGTPPMLQPLAWNSLPQYLSISTNSNTIPNTPTSFIYTYNLPWPHAGFFGTTPIADQRFNYLLDHGNYTFEVFNLQCGCYHTAPQTPNPQFHSIPLGPGGPVGSGLLPFTVPAAVGCGPPPGPGKWLCHGDYHCEEHEVQGGIPDYDVMVSIWGMAKNMWGVGRNFGWTESTSQFPPNGATHIESDQSVDLTRPGEILDGLQPYTIQTVNLGSTTNPIWQANQIPNTGVHLNHFISVLPRNIGAAIPDMPANPVSNAWTTAQNVPGGGATTYSPINPNHPQALLWNPTGPVLNYNPNNPANNMVGGYTSYRGVVIPPLGATTTTTSLDNTFHGTPNWTPFHDTLSSCIACCGDVHHQFDENLQINPYYGPYMTPPGWNDPQNPVPSNNQDFEDWLDGTNNPWGIPLPREGGQVQLYKFYKGANMCGGTWID